MPNKNQSTCTKKLTVCIHFASENNIRARTLLETKGFRVLSVLNKTPRHTFGIRKVEFTKRIVVSNL